MFGNLLSALGSYATIKHSEVAAFGAFQTRRKINIAVSDGKTTGRRSYAAREEFTALGHVSVELGMIHQDTRGINKTLVDDDGNMSPELLVAKLRNYGAVNRDALIDITANGRLWMRDDSQVALLVSMLSTIYTLKYGETRHDIRAQDYDDGHISVKVGTMFDQPELAGDWRASNENLSTRTWQQKTIVAPPTGPVLHLPGFTAKEVAIVLQHVAGRQKTTELAFDLAIPSLADVVYVSGAAGIDSSMADRDTTSAQVEGTLNKYVSANRLYGAFETALAIYCQVALTPVPDTAEGLAWLRRGRSVVLPSFDSMRGLYTVLMLEDGFGISSAVTHTWKWWRDFGLNTAVAHAPYNAIALWGRYMVEGGFYDKAADVYRLGSLEFDSSPGTAYYAYASLLTGGDVYCAVPPTYGLTYAAWDPEHDYRIPVTVADLGLTGYHVERDAAQNVLIATIIPPPCSASFILGRCGSEGAFSALSSHYTIPIKRSGNSWVVPSVDKAWGFGMATRWLGYNAVMRFDGVQRIANWASNASSIAARPFYIEGPDIKTVDIVNVFEREHHFDFLPSLGHEDTLWTVDVDATDLVSVSSLRKQVIGAVGVFTPKMGSDPKVLMPVTTRARFVPIVLKAVKADSALEAGFQISHPATAQQPPESVMARVAEELPDAGKQTEDAGGTSSSALAE